MVGSHGIRATQTIYNTGTYVLKYICSNDDTLQHLKTLDLNTLLQDYLITRVISTVVQPSIQPCMQEVNKAMVLHQDASGK